MMGTTETMELETKNTFQNLKLHDPKNSGYYQCLENEFSSDAIIDKLRPFYKKIFSEQTLQNLYELLKTETGQKVIQLVKAGPPFENARATLTQEEIRKIENAFKSLKAYMNDTATADIQRAVQNGAQELAVEARARCRINLPTP